MKQTLPYLVLILIGLLTFTAPTRADSGQALTFHQAVELMNENNLSLQIARINLELAEIDYEKALASNLMSTSQQGQMQAEHNLERAKHTYRTAKRNNYLEVFRAYTEVLSTRRTLAIRELERKIADHDYTIVQEKVRIGDAGRLDDLREMNRLEAAKRAELTAKQNLVASEGQLRRLLGLGDDEDLVLTFDFALPELELTLEESLEMGLANSFTLRDQKTSLELQERQLQTAKIDGTAPIDVRRSELSIEVSRLNLEQEESNLAGNITSSFQSLADLKARFVSAERDWEIAQETYDLYRQQEERGLITEVQLLEQEISRLNSEHNRIEAQAAYLVAYLQFYHLLGLDGSLQ